MGGNALADLQLHLILPTRTLRGAQQHRVAHRLCSSVCGVLTRIFPSLQDPNGRGAYRTARPKPSWSQLTMPCALASFLRFTFGSASWRVRLVSSSMRTTPQPRTASARGGPTSDTLVGPTVWPLLGCTNGCLPVSTTCWSKLPPFKPHDIFTKAFTDKVKWKRNVCDLILHVDPAKHWVAPSLPAGGGGGGGSNP